nr:hypothetical protein CFP56_50339 [Quercus suber]
MSAVESYLAKTTLPSSPTAYPYQLVTSNRSDTTSALSKSGCTTKMCRTTLRPGDKQTPIMAKPPAFQKRKNCRPGTLSDDTISTNTSEGGSPIFITPLEHHTLGSIDLPELCSPAKSVLNDRVTIRSAGSDSSVLGDFPRSQISSDVDPSSFRLRPRYGEETAVEIQICDRDPNRYYCQKVDHPCRFGRNNGNGFGRIQDRDRHEKVLHPTKEHPSGREPCPKCGVLMRPDKHGEHWRKSCKENPHRKPH